MPRLRLLTTILAAGAMAILGSSLAASPALAGLTGGGLTIVATTDAGDAASFQIEIPPDVSSWTWTSSERIEMRSPTTGELIAVLNPDGRSSWVEYMDDPLVALSFTVQSGPVPTSFFISSALLSFPVIATAEGRATTGFSLTDFDGDGATLTGIGDPSGSQGAYLAQYNGFAGTVSGTTFAEVIHSITTGVYSTTTANADVPLVGYSPIGPPVSDMSVLVSFTLSAFDLASGTSNYVILERPLATEEVTWGRVKSLYK